VQSTTHFGNWEAFDVHRSKDFFKVSINIDSRSPFADKPMEGSGEVQEKDA
jgi:hypothetical protein